MSALPPKADIFEVIEKSPLMTQSGHWLMSGKRGVRPLFLAHEQEVAAVVASVSYVGILQRLLGGDHHRSAHF